MPPIGMSRVESKKNSTSRQLRIGFTAELLHLSADVGVGTTTALLDGLRAQVTEGTIEGPDALIDALKADLEARLEGDRSLAVSEDGTTIDGIVSERDIARVVAHRGADGLLAAVSQPMRSAPGPDTFSIASIEML